jgi:inner membrane protein
MHAFFKSATVKLFVLGALSLLLLIPLLMVGGVIRERLSLKEFSEQEISSRHGGPQRLIGPFIVLKRECQVELKSRFVLKACDEFVLPETLEIDGDLQSSIKYLGLYEAPVYDGSFGFRGAFDLPLTASAGAFNGARLAFALSDPRGIRAVDEVSLGGRKLNFATSGLSISGMSVLEAAIPADLALDQALDYVLKFRLAGSRNVSLVPMGRTTQATLKSNWPDPGFTGAFSPAERKVTEQGFSARWQVLELNRPLPQRATGAFPIDEAHTSAFAVDLAVLASDYQQVERTLKYGFLFIVLSFAGYFLFEVLVKVRLHPVQYGLIGAALTVFYLLLLALSELIGFAAAYAAGAVALSLLIGAYSAAILHSARRGMSAGGLLAAIYAVLYVLVASEEHALLLGAIVLLTVIALTMYLTRHIDWYGERNQA